MIGEIFLDFSITKLFFSAKNFGFFYVVEGAELQKRINVSRIFNPMGDIFC